MTVSFIPENKTIIVQICSNGDSWQTDRVVLSNCAQTYIFRCLNTKLTIILDKTGVVLIGAILEVQEDG